jgi:poly(A) polymerase
LEFFEPAALRAVQALQHMKPFTITLQNFGFFQHGKTNRTIFLDPEGNTAPDESSALLALHRALLTAFPSCDDTATISARGFVPHLSVAQSQGPLELDARWHPVSFLVEQVFLLHRADNGDPFHVRCVIPFGSVAAPDFVDHKYSAEAFGSDSTRPTPTTAQAVAPVGAGLELRKSRKRIVHPWQT